MSFCNIGERSHVRRLAKQVHSHNCARPARNNGFLYALWIDQISLGIDINEPVEDDKGYLVSIYRVKMKKFTESAIAYGKSPATCPVPSGEPSSTTKTGR